jgi:SAM-dependent methyltransferase
MRLFGSESYRLKKMARLCAGRRRVLDLGPVEMPNPHLSNPEVIGLDMDRGVLPPNYRECAIGDVMALPAPFGPGSFDAIHAGEIIEHVEGPVDFLRGCLKALSPGGLLVLSTPNPNSPYERLLTITLCRRFMYDRNRYRPRLDHVCLYPQRWLIRMMEIAGFEDVRLHSGGIFVPLLGQIPFPRPWCYQTIATGLKPT